MPLTREELAARAAVCIDNARLYRREHERALILQRSLLPPGDPEAAGLVLYRLVDRLVRTAVLDRVVVVLGLVLFVAFLALRLLVLRVRY